MLYFQSCAMRIKQPASALKK